MSPPAPGITIQSAVPAYQVPQPIAPAVVQSYTAPRYESSTVIETARDYYAPPAKVEINTGRPPAEQITIWNNQNSSAAQIEIQDGPSSMIFHPAQRAGSVGVSTNSSASLSVNWNEPFAGFWIQVGSYSELKHAQDTWRNFFLSGWSNSQIFGKMINAIMYYRVKVGPYNDRLDAENALSVIKGSGFNDAYIVRQ